MKIKPISKTQLPGSFVDGQQRDQKVLHKCREVITLAGTCRRSGSPDTALQLLRGVFPVLLAYVHARFVGGRRCISPGAMVEDLSSNGIIEDEGRVLLTSATSGFTEFASGRSVADAMRACLFLWKIICSSEYQQLTRQVRESKLEPRRQGFLIRWAQAACGLIGVGVST